MFVEFSFDISRWSRRARQLLSALIATVVLPQALSAAQNPATPAHVDSNGVAHLPAMTVPPSEYLSTESRSKFIALFSNPKPRPAGSEISRLREHDEQKNAPLVARDEVLYPVNIEPRTIGGVRTQVITTKGGVAPENRNRVLINLHGGGFIWGEDNGARTESIPIAGLGKITVITVAYRLAPEFKFPAASEDVAAVYRELLKDHAPADIGIYGCSAGGILTAQAVAWFQKEKLPPPGAIGTFCGSAVPLGGDSDLVAAALVGEPPPDNSNPYLSGALPSDPLASALRRFSARQEWRRTCTSGTGCGMRSSWIPICRSSGGVPGRGELLCAASREARELCNPSLDQQPLIAPGQVTIMRPGGVSSGSPT